MRLFSLVKQDICFQFRHGFYYVYAFVTLLYVILLRFLPVNIRQVAGPLIIFSDPAALGFFFIGAILFFEKQQRVAEVLFVSPLSEGEYILSKCISLTLISLMASLIIGFLSFGRHCSPAELVPGVVLTSFFFILLGILLSYRLKTITAYLFAGGLILLPFCLPLVSFLGFSDSLLFFLIPTTGSLHFIFQGTGSEGSVLTLLFSAVYLLAGIIILYKAAVKRLKAHIAGCEGGHNEN